MSQNLALAMRRQDSNRMALRAVRSILAAAHPLELTIEGTRVEVAVERLPPLAWPPGGLMGLEEAVDGPLPPSARLRCSWPGGEVELLLSVVWWNSNASNRHLICLRLSVASPQRELIWITVAGRLAETQEGNVTLHAWFSPAPRRDEDKAELLSTYGLPVRLAVQRSGLPNVTNARVDVFAVDVETGEVAPSAEEAYRRLVHLGLLKLPLILRGQYESVVGKPLYDLGSLAAKGGSMHAPLLEKPASEKRLGIGTMPGGVREYKKTLDALLQALAGQSLSKEDFIALLRERYGVQSPHAWHSYGTVLENLGVVTVTDGHVTLSPAGEAYLQDPSPQALFELLHRAFQGILETLVIVEQGGGDSATVRAQLLRLLGVSWEKTEQSGRRRDWLLSLGATERSGGRDTLTELGLALLAVHGEEAESIRHALREGSVVEEEEGEADGRGEEDALEKSVAEDAETPPPGWEADRVDLSAARAAEYTRGLQLPRLLLEQACAALSAGKHLLLVGPPGTGKTELAHVLADAARAEGYCKGAFVTTASADWTTFETIGGYALQRDRSLALRPGAFLQAVARWQWLVIDELNRADVDRAFGELMTVLAGRSTQTALVQEDGRTVSIGDDPTCTHRVFGSFRVIATMNTWDKTSLFRLSHAVQRRFAVLHVDVPDDATYAALLKERATQPGMDPELPDEAVAPLRRLFSSEGLLAHRAIGPAVALDMVRYMRRRQASGDGLAEAIQMLLFPQLEGLEQEAAFRVLDLLTTQLAGWASPEAVDTLRRRYEELFPHLSFKAP